jgi:hypothetical protein
MVHGTTCFVASIHVMHRRKTTRSSHEVFLWAGAAHDRQFSWASAHDPKVWSLWGGPQSQIFLAPTRSAVNDPKSNCLEPLLAKGGPRSPNFLGPYQRCGSRSPIRRLGLSSKTLQSARRAAQDRQFSCALSATQSLLGPRSHVELAIRQFGGHDIQLNAVSRAVHLAFFEVPGQSGGP